MYIWYDTDMHIFFSGIGGTGIGPLALIAKQAGFTVSGSDKQDSQYIDYLQSKNINDIHIGQTREALAQSHQNNPIDWFVYSSALPHENPDHPELIYVQENNIKHSKRDMFLKYLLQDMNLKLVAIAGTHGKTTTTAMAIWVFKSLNIAASYSVGAKISFGDMGQYDSSSEYFIYECDEYDRNFLSFDPHLSLISGLAWDHHDIYPSVEDYQEAFRDFLSQSAWKYMWRSDLDFLSQETDDSFTILEDNSEGLQRITLPGIVNRRDAWLVVQGLQRITEVPIEKLIGIVNRFPGVSRRMEQITDNLFSDYAHTPEKLKGGTQAALEIAQEKSKKLIIVYEPLTNRRMYHTKEHHHDVFTGAEHIYWVPTYLAREDPSQVVLTPNQLVTFLDGDLQAIATPMELNDTLKNTIRQHLKANDMIVCFSGGGGNSLDEWLRKEFN